MDRATFARIRRERGPGCLEADALSAHALRDSNEPDFLDTAGYTYARTVSYARSGDRGLVVFAAARLNGLRGHGNFLRAGDRSESIGTGAAYAHIAEPAFSGPAHYSH